MNLRSLNDKDLLAQTQRLAQNERELLMQILHHLREVERRRLFCDLGLSSLFEHCVRELKYSEGQAGRRIQAMRLLKELPQLESKIESGEMSLSSICQAQSYFREEAKALRPLGANNKINILARLENKSARESQKILLELQSPTDLPKERERVVSPSHIEVRFVLDQTLQSQLNELRSLLGPKGITMNWQELVGWMTGELLQIQKAKKLGKKRALATPTSELRRSKNPRHIPRATKYQIWQRDGGRCNNCGTDKNIQFDHIHPVAWGGTSNQNNIRLLCFHCNQRAAAKKMGQQVAEKWRS